MVYKFSTKFLIEKFLKKIGACKKISVTKKYLTEKVIGRGRVDKKIRSVQKSFAVKEWDMF